MGCGYYKFLGDFSVFKPNGEASPHEVLSLKDYDFNVAEKFFKDAETVRRNEILQQIANGEKREELRKSKLTTSQIKEIVDQKRKAVAEEVVSERYGLPAGARVSVDLDSDIETKVLTETPEKVGEGLAKIFSHISEEDEELFNYYLLYWHNTRT